jgi:hypothetical protein
MSRVQLLVKPAPDDIVDAINQRASEEGISAQEVVAEILAKAVKVKYRADRPAAGEPLPAPRDPIGYGKVFTRVPPAVKGKLAVAAAQRGITIRGIVLEALANSFGLAPPDPRRQPPRGA